MNELRRKIALDVGDVRIGIALSDGLLITAQGLTTVERVGIKKDTTAIVELIKEHNCDTVVVGLPINLDGSDSVQTEKVRDFKTKLENKINSMGIKNVQVLFQDERFTTKIAEKALIQGNLSRSQRKAVIDKQAAIIILQSYLDRISMV